MAHAAAAPTAEGPSAADVFALLDGDGDGCVTEAELRAAAEARGIELTEEQVQAFMALEADRDCVSLEAYSNSFDSFDSFDSSDSSDSFDGSVGDTGNMITGITVPIDITGIMIPDY